ncbi:MAG: hypothetical protein A2922_02765 [Candidatus Nealsonbacteria bacterium RIFCSPLOWO2_01_FULL_43_36]|uniref:Uncharacterized protein n=1 Tax=Candidatus Nealsonbacteria bacterium RIFCSPHIGHO2_02_FULL_43_13 TaxID=1801668 RepID=A0A1G2E914_9BACT|nr:MAG: hypothetical protein A3D46_00560 [Candidatus Nealsonbacteria bacterium RIFCSPHIGHO2_02_FULL_43_13]OGZ25328.1 MAG: hypothetical protein A2922_02765 [Candidatus Nealsonbacteria bacterium RIFCSPLOWO2_01_FULL_43_36]
MKKIITIVLIINIALASFPLSALAQEAPQTMEEAKVFGLNLLERLPNAIKNVWQNQALPIWWNMWVWTKGFWERTLGGWVENIWQKLWRLTGKETPDVKNEFQKEKQEMQKDLWERFKELF